jgi:hypothetical protein
MKHRTSSHRRRKTWAGRVASAAARGATRRLEPPRWIEWRAERLLVFPFSRRIERPELTGVLREQLVAALRTDAERLRAFSGEEFKTWCV